jgi:hypothetical protein
MSTDHAVRLRAVLDDLESNRISTADAAAQVRQMTFPVMPRKTIAEQMSESAESEMPARLPEGGFHEVAQALTAGRIDMRQYEALAEAAAEAMKVQRAAQA